MKKATAIGILFIMLTNGAGFYMYYSLQLVQLKKEKREAMRHAPPETLDLLKLSCHDYKEASVEEHEIHVDRKMYDVARVEISGDSVTVWCRHDKEEDDLLAFIKEIVAKPLKNKTNMPSQVLDYLSLTYIIPQFEFHASAKGDHNIPASIWQFTIKLYSVSFNAPPPEPDPFFF